MSKDLSKKPWKERCKLILEKHSIAPLGKLKLLMGNKINPIPEKTNKENLG